MGRCRDCGGVVRGTLGVARSIFGLRVLSEGGVRQRLEICKDCDQSIACKHNERQVCRCHACGCWLRHKARLRDEVCPLGKW